MTSARPGGLKSLATFRTFNPFKIHPLDLIRRNPKAALRARLIERRQHFLQVDFFVIGAANSGSGLL